MVTGIHISIVSKLVRRKILFLSLAIATSFKEAYGAAKKLAELRRAIYGDKKVIKAVKNHGKYYWDIYIPGWPSETFNRFATSELSRINPDSRSGKVVLNTLIFAITKKCPLQCEHCFEWDELNKKEVLDEKKIDEIICDFVEAGVLSVHISGGEPLTRLNHVSQIVNKYKDKTDFWMLTSGYHLDEAKAKVMGDCGVTGVIISLDHYDSEKHNSFRGNRNSFEWVEKAIINCKKNKMLVAITVCVTREFCNQDDLGRYMQMARRLNVDFVQWLEPKAVGHYSGMDVALSKENENLLERLYLEYNFSSNKIDFPIVDYHGYHQRRLGCFSAGSRNIYINTDGQIQPCPFCKTKLAKVSDIANGSVVLEEIKCERYEKVLN